MLKFPTLDRITQKDYDKVDINVGFWREVQSNNIIFSKN